MKWRKSSSSISNDCVEVAPLPGVKVALRDSKNPDSGYFTFTQHEWNSFLFGVRNGEFDDLVPGDAMSEDGARLLVQNAIEVSRLIDHEVGGEG